MKNTRHSNWQKSINQLKDEMNELLSKRKELTLKSKDIWINTSGDAKTRRRLHRDICGNVMCNEICSLRKQIRENSTLSHMFKKLSKSDYLLFIFI